MKSYYFLKKDDRFFDYDISIEQYLYLTDRTPRCFQETEAVRLYYNKDEDGFNGRFLHEKWKILFYTQQKSPKSLIRRKVKEGYQQIDLKTYKRYKRAIISVYHQQIAKNDDQTDH